MAEAKTEYKIESGIPQPPSLSGRKKYPLREMEVGDSFVVDADQHTRLMSAVAYFGKRNNRKYSIRKVDGSLRCWRVK